MDERVLVDDGRVSSPVCRRQEPPRTPLIVIALAVGFALVGLYGALFFVLTLPGALFVGPHGLVITMGHLVVAIGSFVLVVALVRRSAAAWWAVVSLCAIILLLALVWAGYLLVHPTAWWGPIDYPLEVAALFLLVLLMLLSRSTRDWFSAGAFRRRKPAE